MTASVERKYFFRCEECGQYSVTEETVQVFLTEKLKKALREALSKGAEGAVLSFSDGCPKCVQEKQKAEVTLSVLHKKVQ